MKNLSDCQKKVLEFIAGNWDRRGQPPSLHEIRLHLGVKAIGTVQDHLRALEKKGFIVRGRKAREISFTARARSEFPEAGPHDVIRLPILGRVAAGTPLFSEENQMGLIEIDRAWVGTDKAYLLKVQGESMIEAHIQDGDFVIVRAQKSAENGEIVVARIEGEVTVKRFYQEGALIRLQPENLTMDPLIVREGAFEILGKVVGVIRKY